jgi:hypothetical protein
MFRRSTTPAALLVVALVAGACATTPAPPSVPDVSGAWTGGVTVEGQAISGTLTLTQNGTELRAVFSAPSFGLTAEGGGTIDADGAFQVQLGYNMQCPGTAALSGRRSSDGAMLSGTVQASDCTGQMLGAFDFTR